MTVQLILSVDALSPGLSGIGRYTWELVQRLPAHPEMLGSTVQFYRGGRWIDSPAALLDEPSAAGLKPSYLKRARLKQPKWWREWRLQSGFRGKLYHGTNFFLPPYVETGVVTVHDLSVYKFPETHPAERIAQFDREFKKSIDRASHLITDSQATRQELIEFLGWPAEKISAVPLGVSPLFAPASAAELSQVLSRYGLTYGGYSLCVSTLEPRKRVANLLQAYRCLPAELRQRYPLVLIGGKGWLSDTLHDEIRRLSDEGWLHYLGFAPEADLPSLYAGARLFVYPSIYEGFGLPVLEAMASGVPVVTSPFTSLPEVTQGAAALVNPDDIEALSNAILTSLLNEDWRAGASAKGLSVAKNYSWDNCIEQTVAVYRKIIT